MKKILAAALGFLLAAAPVSAEQPKAQEYREILSSGNFYVEYDDKNSKRILAEENGLRMERTDLSGAYRAAVSILNPVAALFSDRNFPNFMHSGGKYFRFLESDEVVMAEETQLDDENLNPTEGWSLAAKQLSLPDELAVLNWHDKFHKVSAAVSEPVFTKSFRKKIDGREYDCDRYEASVKNAGGGTDATIIFDLCYDSKGVLAIAQSAILANDKEYAGNKITVKKFQREIPKGALNFSRNAEVFAAGVGDMNDLLEKPVLVGKLKEVLGS